MMQRCEIWMFYKVPCSRKNVRTCRRWAARCESDPERSLEMRQHFTSDTIGTFSNITIRCALIIDILNFWLVLLFRYNEARDKHSFRLQQSTTRLSDVRLDRIGWKSRKLETWCLLRLELDEVNLKVVCSRRHKRLKLFWTKISGFC